MPDGPVFPPATQPNTQETTVTIIPTDVAELSALLRRTPIGEWPDVDDLAAEIGDFDRAVKIFNAAENEALRDNEIDALRGALGVALDDASARLQEAGQAIDRLSSSQVYDAEYAETVMAEDLRHQLAEAARTLRIAQALKKQIER
jgi:hypothetical protein